MHYFTCINICHAIQKWSIKYYNHCATHSTFFASFSYYKI